ncbi:MAG: penicillin-binding transpeptidase domain-containing protein, partial [Jatrophihabitantaceae bacterium]
SVLDGPLGLVWRQVKAELQADGIDPATINTKGLRITTTIDKAAQAAAETAINSNFSGLQPFQKNLLPALTAINPANGGVVAYYGGKNGIGFDYANGYRPPGSSFKPYTLATALTQNLKGVKPAYALNSQFDGSYCVTIEATRICNDPGDAGLSGYTTLAFAMKASLNTTFDGLAAKVGPANVAATAHAMGIAKTRSDNGKPTLVDSAGQTSFGIGIGDSDYSVRPLDQATGFATIANGGTTYQPFFINKVTDAKGDVLFQHKVKGTRSLDARVANDVGLSLKPIADWSRVPLNNGRESGAKTGTAGIQGDSNGNNSDAWMVGYTPQVSAAVWVGSGKTQPIFNSNHLPEYGSDLPGHIWRDFMGYYLAGKPALPLPTKQQVGVAAPVTASASSSTPTTSAPTTSAAPSTSASRTSAPPVSSSATSSAPAPAPCPSPGVLVGGICVTPKPTPNPTPSSSGPVAPGG